MRAALKCAHHERGTAKPINLVDVDQRARREQRYVRCAPDGAMRRSIVKFSPGFLGTLFRGKRHRVGGLELAHERMKAEN